MSHSAIVESLRREWAVALRPTDIPVEMCSAYGDALAAEFVTLEHGCQLTDDQLQQLNVRIGHRQVLLRAAADYHVSQTVRGNAAASSSGSISHVALSTAHIDGVSRVAREIASTSVTWEATSGTANSFEQFKHYMLNLRQEYGLPPTFDRCFEDNKPMPFILQQGSNLAVLIRIPDLSNQTGTTLASITNRIVIMMTGNNVLTYHRCAENPFLSVENAFSEAQYSKLSAHQLLGELVRCALESYREGHVQLQKWSDDCDEMKDKIDAAEELTLLQKQGSVYIRCLGANVAALNQLIEAEPSMHATFESIISTMETTKTMIEEVQENAVGSIDLLIALDDFRNGSNLKIFTYISVICQPIGVATGWYGMNFTNMPELHFQESYFVFISTVLGMCGIIFTFLMYHAYKR